MFNKALDSRKVLLVIDMQVDFVTGSLGSPEAEAIVPAVKAKVHEYVEKGYMIIFTRDTHQADYLQTNEGKNLPVEHCIEGTSGWQIFEGLKVPSAICINKPTFGYLKWKELDFTKLFAEVGYELENLDAMFEEIEIIGLCTDICVVSNALILKALFPEAKISVDSNCCAGVTPRSHDEALNTMAMCQIAIK